VSNASLRASMERTFFIIDNALDRATNRPDRRELKLTTSKNLVKRSWSPRTGK
jgi:hypothetical protein